MRAMDKKFDLKAMSIDELWRLHEELNRILSIRLTSEKRQLEKRLAQLQQEAGARVGEATDAPVVEGARRERRKYPRVYPKYRNPKEPSETWSGRGKQPRWLTAALKTGRSIEEFAIKSPATKTNLRGRHA